VLKYFKPEIGFVTEHCLSGFYFVIIPTNQNGFIGKIKAPALNSGKIKIGQK
jgi:hypothetical protein